MEKKKFIQIFVLCDIFLLYTEPKTSFVNNVLFGVNERRKIYVSPKLQITKPLVFQLSMLRPHQRA